MACTKQVEVVPCGFLISKRPDDHTDDIDIKDSEWKKNVENTIKIVIWSMIKLVHKLIYSDVSTSYIQIKTGFSYSILKQ